MKGARPPREVTRETITEEEINRIPGTNGDAIRSLAEPPRRRAAACAPRPAHRPRLGPCGHAGLRRRHRDPDHLPLRRSLLGRADGGARQDRLLPGQLQHAVRPGDGRHRRRRHPRSEAGRHSTASRRSTSSTSAPMVEGPISAAGPSSRRGVARTSTCGSGRSSTSLGAGVTAAPVYYDYQALVEKKWSAKESFRVMFFGSDDKFALSGQHRRARRTRRSAAASTTTRPSGACRRGT